MHLRDERDVRRRGDRDGACVDDEPAAHARDERGERPDEADGGGQDGVDAVAEEYLCGWILVLGLGLVGGRDKAYLGEGCNERAEDDEAAECGLRHGVAGDAEKHDGSSVQLVHNDNRMAEL